MLIKIILAILGILSAVDIVYFIIYAFGNPIGAFTGGISRPFGIFVMPMFAGFIFKLVEAALVAAAIVIWF